jgi:hypothetical protein
MGSIPCVIDRILNSVASFVKEFSQETQPGHPMRAFLVRDGSAPVPVKRRWEAK